MKALIKKITRQAFSEHPNYTQEILGLGQVNRVFEVQLSSGDYVLRINQNKTLEYQKEAWCLKATAQLGIPGPAVLKTGQLEGYDFMILQKLKGQNGSLLDHSAQTPIWKTLGQYSKRFQVIQGIKIAKEKDLSFHQDWKAKLCYNIEQLHSKDSLVQDQVFNATEHQNIKAALNSILEKPFQFGLVHGDLHPRNVIVQHPKIYLLDWGTAEIDVVPHTEIGNLLADSERSKTDLDAFLEGMKISPTAFEDQYEDILVINLLNSLDKYRWACGQTDVVLKDYSDSVLKAFRTWKIKRLAV